MITVFCLVLKAKLSLASSLYVDLKKVIHKTFD